MAYVPTTFVDRSVEFPNRRKLTAVQGQADTFDVARAEGTVFADGTKLDAANLNAEFGKIKTETDSINTNLTNSQMYSTTNEKIVGTWIDNKPIYRKVIHYGTLPNNASKNVAHNIPNISFVTDYYGIGYRPTNNSWERIPMTDTANAIGFVRASIDLSSITTWASGGFDASVFDAYFIVEYTKTTD